MEVDGMVKDQKDIWKGLTKGLTVQSQTNLIISGNFGNDLTSKTIQKSQGTDIDIFLSKWKSSQITPKSFHLSKDFPLLPI